MGGDWKGRRRRRRRRSQGTRGETIADPLLQSRSPGNPQDEQTAALKNELRWMLKPSSKRVGGGEKCQLKGGGGGGGGGDLMGIQSRALNEELNKALTKVGGEDVAR
eukprot:408030-Hanusia_phi.AAC.2